MPRTNLPPSCRFHKARNCAVVTIDGRNRCLGPFGSPESKEKYARLFAEADSTRRQGLSLPGTSGQANPTIDELVLADRVFARTHYVKHGRPTDEQTGIRQRFGFFAVCTASRPLATSALRA